jgi:hypothetical protein
LEISSTGLLFQKRNFYIFKKPWSKWKTETQNYYSKAAVSLLGLTISGFEIYILRKRILFLFTGFPLSNFVAMVYSAAFEPWFF